LDIGHVTFDPKTLVVDKLAFNNVADWKEFYREVQEEIPPKMPKLQGQRVTISAFVDANYAGINDTHIMEIFPNELATAVKGYKIRSQITCEPFLLNNVSECD
jgi:hypothetical protein